MISGLSSQASMPVSQMSPYGDIQSNNIEKTEVVAQDRVSILAEQIKNGTYEVDVPKMAEAVAEELSR